MIDAHPTLLNALPKASAASARGHCAAADDLIFRKRFARVSSNRVLTIQFFPLHTGILHTFFGSLRFRPYLLTCFPILTILKRDGRRERAIGSS